MKDRELREKLFEKLEQNMKEYRRELLQCSPEALIDRAAEIHAAKMVYDELRSGEYWDDQYEYLLRFENPLEVVTDHWSGYLELDVHDEMSNILSELEESGCENFYDLDPKYSQPPGGMSMT